MKINPLSVCLFLIITLTIVKAQRYSKFNKPMIDLNNKPQVTTPRLPEERRKLSIFPKSMVKYVVTSKPYAKVRSYSPYPVTTKKPLIQQLVPKEIKNIRTMAATRAPIMKYNTMATTTQFTPKRQYSPRFQYTTKPPVTQIPKHTIIYESEEDRYMEAPSTRYNVAYNSENNLSSFDEKDYEDESEADILDKKLSTYSSTDKIENTNERMDLDAVESNDRNQVNVAKALELANKEEGDKKNKKQLANVETEKKRVEHEQEEEEEYSEESEIEESENQGSQNAEAKDHILDPKEPKLDETESKESENSRKKRLSMSGRSVYNKIEVVENKPTKEDINTASEKKDRNEFIFIKDYLKPPVDIKKSSKNITAEIEESVEIATEIAWLDELKSRPERT